MAAGGELQEFRGKVERDAAGKMSSCSKKETEPWEDPAWVEEGQSLSLSPRGGTNWGAENPWLDPETLGQGQLSSHNGEKQPAWLRGWSLGVREPGGDLGL